MTIAEQMKNQDRQLIIDIFQAILDVSVDSTKEEIIHLLTKQRDMMERRKR